MTLRELLAGATPVSPPESVANAEVRGLEYDSRKVEPGYVFFAFPGARVWMGVSSRRRRLGRASSP